MFIDPHRLGAIVRAEDLDTGAVTENSDFFGILAKLSRTDWTDGYWTETRVSAINKSTATVSAARENYFGVKEDIVIDLHRMGGVIRAENQATGAISIFGDASLINNGFLLKLQTAAHLRL